MAFDKKHYKQIKAFIRKNIFKYGHSPLGYAAMFKEEIEKENYESAQAIKDVLDEWLELNVSAFTVVVSSSH